MKRFKVKIWAMAPDIFISSLNEKAEKAIPRLFIDYIFALNGSEILRKIQKMDGFWSGAEFIPWHCILNIKIMLSPEE